MEKDFDIFISYSRKDLNKVKEIKAIIEKSTGAQCWMDLKGGIKSGDPRFIKTITDAIDNSVVFLFMRSADSQKSEYALLELSYANKETNSHVVIVNIDDSEWINEFRFLYRYTDAIDWANLDQREKLTSDIKAWIEKRNEIKSKAEEEARSIAEAKIQELEKDRDGLTQQLLIREDVIKELKMAVSYNEKLIADERAKRNEAEEMLKESKNERDCLKAESIRIIEKINKLEEDAVNNEKLIADERAKRIKAKKVIMLLREEIGGMDNRLSYISGMLDELIQEADEKAKKIVERKSKYNTEEQINILEEDYNKLRYKLWPIKKELDQRDVFPIPEGLEHWDLVEPQ